MLKSTAEMKTYCTHSTGDFRGQKETPVTLKMRMKMNKQKFTVLMDPAKQTDIGIMRMERERKGP